MSIYNQHYIMFNFLIHPILKEKDQLIIDKLLHYSNFNHDKIIVTTSILVHGFIISLLIQNFFPSLSTIVASFPRFYRSHHHNHNSNNNNINFYE